MTMSDQTQAGQAIAWNGDLVRSRFLDAISLLLPAAETFLLGTIGEWLHLAAGQLTPSQRADVDRFLAEEEAHQRVHHRYNHDLLALRPALAEVARRAERLADGVKTLPLQERVALAAAFEQLTALLSKELLAHEHLLGRCSSPQARIWRWHAREELSHRHVALIAAAQSRVGYAARCTAYLAASAYLLSDVLSLWWAACRCDARAGVPRMALLGQAACFALRSLPSMARMAWGWLAYWRPGALRHLIGQGSAAPSMSPR